MDDGYESEEEFNEINKRILELKNKNHVENNAVNDICSSSDAEDSDYEIIAGDLALYDSAIE